MKRLKMSISQSTRKCTSIILSLVMVISWFSFSMITTNATSDTATKTVKVNDATKATDVEGLVTNKTATANADGTFTLNLEAYAKGEIKTTEVSKPSDIVLTLDVSGSMYDTIGGKLKLEDLDISKPDGYYKLYTRYVTGEANVMRYHNGKWEHYSPNYDSWLEIGEPESQTYHVTRIGALKEAANNFIDSVAADCKNLDSSLKNKHRIAITTFADKGEALQGFLDVSNSSNINGLKEKISNLKLGGATHTSEGMRLAYDYFNKDSLKNDQNRNKVEIMFTDGTPTGISNIFNTDVANDAILYANKIKNQPNIKAQVYTIGIFTGANTTGDLPDYNILNDTIKSNRFMHLVSSNYPNSSSMKQAGADGSTDKGYYLAADDADGLSKIFEKISESIGKPSVELNQSAILQDVLSDEFVLAGEGIGSIEIFTMNYNGKDNSGNDIFNDKQKVENLNVAINSDRNTIQVSGFDYGKNFCAISDNGDGPTGKKLIVEITVKRNQTTYGGNGISTNTIASAIYDGISLSPVETFPVPSVNLPIRYDITTNNKSIYLGETVNANELIELPNNYKGQPNENFDINCLPNGINNRNVDITYKLVDGNSHIVAERNVIAGTSVGDELFTEKLNDLNENSNYEIVVNINNSNNVSGVNAGVNNINIEKSASVYVFAPVIQVTDQTIFYGESLNDLSDSISDVKWVCENTGASSPKSDKPNVTYEFKQVDNKEIPNHLTLEDTLNVKIDKVKLNGKAVDSQYVQIIKDECTLKDHEDGRDFTIHVVKGQIEINKKIDAQYSNESRINSYQTFIYKIERSETEGGPVVETFYQTLSFDATKNDKEAKAIISNLKKGYYTVTEEEKWSKKYTLTSTTDNYQSLNGEVGAGKKLPIGTFDKITGYYGLDEKCYQEKGFNGKKAQVTFKNDLKSWAGWYSDAAGSKNTFNK